MDTASFFVPLMIFHKGLTVLTDYSSPQGTPDLHDVSAAGRFKMILCRLLPYRGIDLFKIVIFAFMIKTGSVWT